MPVSEKTAVFRYKSDFEHLPEDEKRKIRKELANPTNVGYTSTFALPEWVIDSFRAVAPSLFSPKGIRNSG